MANYLFQGGMPGKIHPCSKSAESLCHRGAVSAVVIIITSDIIIILLDAIWVSRLLFSSINLFTGTSHTVTEYSVGRDTTSFHFILRVQSK